MLMFETSARSEPLLANTRFDESHIMARTIGENISSEWRREPFADELLPIVADLEKGNFGRVGELKDLGEIGSPLAAMYIGHGYAVGQYGLHTNLVEAEAWLTRSWRGGSIEAGYRLSAVHWTNGQDEKAMDVLRKLADAGYSPAAFRLALLLYKKDKSAAENAVAKAFFERAYSLGHLYAGTWLSHIMITKERKFRSVIKGIIIRTHVVFASIKYLRKFPTSDRLRD